MDELEFRRRVYANPHTTDEEVIAAAQKDPSKTALWKELKQIDDKLSVVAKVPVPDDLAHRLIWQQTTADFVKHQRRSRWYLAVAASVAFSVGIGATLWYQQKPVDIGNQALAHMRYVALEVPQPTVPVTVTQINAKLAGFGGHLVSDIGDVEVANYCYLSNVQALHLIVNTDQGKMSIFVVQYGEDFTFPAHFSDKNYRGSGFAYQNAKILVVGNKDADLELLKTKVKQSLQFSV